MRFAILLGFLLAHEAPCMTLPPSADTVRATISEILSSRDLVGRDVRVTGRCLAAPGLRPIGPPPRKRSDWQLADDTTAIYVTGQVPTGCSDKSLVTVVARVMEYNVAMRGRPAGVV